jgi:CBS domain containing-hemolysin-like protein
MHMARDFCGLAAPSNGRARLARYVTSHLDSYLSTTQLGITLASLGLGWLGEPFLAEMIEPFFTLANITSPVLIETAAFGLAFGTITLIVSPYNRTRFCSIIGRNDE